MKRIAAYAVVGIAAALAAGCSGSGKSRFADLDNARFYDASGKFDEAAAKAVYIDFLKESGYPINDAIIGKIWVSDFNLGRFTKAGLGGIIWWGDEKNNFSSLDAFLLPGQIIPEHWHEAVDTIPAKMEAWLVRHGEIYGYAEGEATPKIVAVLDPAEAASVTVRKENIMKVGDVAGITHPLEKHWMQAGPDGAVFSEFSTYHAGKAVKFTDSKIKF